MFRSTIIFIVLGIILINPLRAATKTYEDGLRDGERSVLEVIRFQYVENKNVRWFPKYDWSREHLNELAQLMLRLELRIVAGVFDLSSSSNSFALDGNYRVYVSTSPSTQSICSYSILKDWGIYYCGLEAGHKGPHELVKGE